MKRNIFIMVILCNLLTSLLNASEDLGNSEIKITLNSKLSEVDSLKFEIRMLEEQVYRLKKRNFQLFTEKNKLKSKLQDIKRLVNNKL